MKKKFLTNKLNFIVALVCITNNFVHAQNFDDKTIDAVIISPVNLLSFNATKSNNDIILNWKTATEFNNSHFVIERSNNGILFNGIGQVAGNGNSNIIHFYSFTDLNTPKVNLFYRLQQVDMNGNTAYSPMVLVKSNKNSEPAMGIYPNPVTQFKTTVITSNLPTEKYLVSIKSLDGKNIYFSVENTITENHPFLLQIPGNIQSGIYLLQISKSTRSTILTQKIILQ
jgi:hypothetical protein